MRQIRIIGLCLAATLAVSAMVTASASATSNGAFAWGLRLLGEVGDGTESGPLCEVGQSLCAPTPVAVSGLGEASGNSVTAVSGGGFYSLALLSSGKVMAWGTNYDGELAGATSEVKSDVPLEVPGLENVVAISSGNAYGLALLSNGTVKAWGGNSSGELGDGTTTNKFTPVTVKGLTGIVAIYAGMAHAVALRSDGTVMAWGKNESGQLGNETTGAYSDEPVEVMRGGSPLTGVTAVAAGGFEDNEHSLALLGSGAVMSWGGDEYGQLGIGSKVPESSAVEVKGLSKVTVTAIAAAGHHSLALLSSGKVMAWGWNAFGQLGIGTINKQKNKPVEVSGLTGATAIAAGLFSSLALRSDKTVAAWGWNGYDELGNGGLIEGSDVPVSVSALNGIVGIGAGTEHSLAYGPSALE